MIDKELMKLLGNGKKYIVCAVISMVIGLFANLGITFSICSAISLTMEKSTAAGLCAGGNFGVSGNFGALCLHQVYRLAERPDRQGSEKGSA